MIVGAVVLALGLTQLPAQGPAVAGVVRSSDGGEPIPYARIQVVNDSVADWTDEAGQYRLEGPASGQWELRVVHAGHDPLELQVTVPADRPVRIDITLQARAAPTPEPLYDFEPFQVEYTLPSLVNTEDVRRQIQSRYPPDLVRQGVGGEAVLRIWLDERGQVVRTVVYMSTGVARLDSLAVAISDRMRFRPAKSRDQPVRVIVQIPVTFTVPDTTLARISAGG